MDTQNISSLLDQYIEDSWDNILADLNTLVSIESYREDDKADALANAPFGPGPRAALDAILGIAARMGLATDELAGHIGWADYPAAADSADGRLIGIIGHVDVVPAGPGWTFPPFGVTRKDGYLLGRGVSDDKGPVLMALYALKFWADQGVRFPYSVRFIFGAAEETGMEDVAYYRARFTDPDFLFTPDAEFPVCYGEKGHFDGHFVAGPFADARILDFQGGSAPNAVPGEAFAIVKLNAAAARDLPAAARITVTAQDDDTVRIDAAGKCEHASTPEGGINAIGLLVQYLLDNDLCTPGERAFLELENMLLSCTDGSAFGCAAADNDFGALTMVGGMISCAQGVFTQTIDARYPTTITSDAILERLGAAAQTHGATAARTGDMPTFRIDPESRYVKALLGAYNQITGEGAKPFTMGGGTYARMFSNAASFGLEKPWEEAPSWVGGMHCPDEGVSEALLKQALKIYALALASF